MQAEQVQPQKPKPTKLANPIKHFHLDYQLPKWATIQPYTKKHQKGSNKPKNRHKLTQFTYYRVGDKIIKILFLNEKEVVEQGIYPFTDPSGQIKNIKEIEGELNRIIYIEMVYIGHYVEQKDGKDVTWLVLKKMTEAKYDHQTSQLQTINDNFQILPVKNEQRFTQFLKVQLANPNAAGMSIRVMVDEKFGQEQKEAEVIDFQFFKREETLKANKVYQQAIAREA